MSNDLVGFVGLGNMGSRMSRRLSEAGYQVLGYDARPIELEHLSFVEDIGTLAHEVDTLFVSLPDGDVVAEVCNRIASTPDRRARTLVDTSTIGPGAARRTSMALAASGITYVDAPVSGGVHGADAGSLSMMVATDRATFDRIEPLLAPIAKHRFHVGEAPGQAQAMKLLNNFLSATAMVATAEAVAFGARQGLDISLMVDVLNVSSGRNSASLEKFPRSIIPETYDYGFATYLMAKDVRLYRENIRDTAELHDVGLLVADLWRRFEDAAPDSDMTRIYKWVQQGGEL